MKTQLVVIVLVPVSPITTQASINRNIDQKVAPGESMKRTKIELRFLRKSLNIRPYQIIASIRLSGNAKKFTGKFPRKSCRSRDKARYMTNTMYGIS